MKKVNLFLISLITLVTLSIGFSSCSDDDDEGGGNSGVLLGTWKANYNAEENSGEKYKWTYTFNSDGTFTRTYPYYAMWEQGKGTYKLNGNKLVIEDTGLYNEANGWLSGVQLEHYANTEEYTIEVIDNNTIKLTHYLEPILNETLKRELK